jgi:hypothetical protein
MPKSGYYRTKVQKTGKIGIDSSRAAFNSYHGFGKVKKIKKMGYK